MDGTVQDRRYGSLERGGSGRDQPRSLRSLVARLRGWPRLYLASLSTSPLSTVYGFDRGQPADRRWIEGFLAKNADVIRGRCLEVQSAEYVRWFGGDRATSVEVLDIDPHNRGATILGDLQNLEAVPDASFDCVVVTQTLQYLRDPRRGVAELHRILSGTGSALVTLPCLGRVEPGDVLDYWRFMPVGAAALFDEQDWQVHVESFGNALLGLAMWTGMAVEDLPARVWERNDPAWPCVVGVRATKDPASTS
jgi:SAM-dependent methyltransferase